tara:strand:- start:566 stop:1309 length:744 start_codon:yes stop_codon:yes gene_type:complete
MPVRGEFFQNPGGAGGFYDYQINQSVRFDRGSSSYLYYAVPSGAGTSTNWTASMWMKRGNLSISDPTLLGNSGGAMRVKIDSSDNLIAQTQTTFTSSFVLRDTTGWTHLVMNSQDTNNFLVYINGVNQTANLTKTSVAAMISFFYGSTNAYIGTDTGGSTKYFDGYLAEVHLVYGLNKAASDFGETKNGVWVPKEYTGGHGTYGAYLKFADASNLGTDSSGNGNNWTAGGMGTDHQSIDSPTTGTGG